MSKEKNKSVEESVKEEKVELCAISREFAIKQINKLVKENQEVFEEYFYWANVLNSPVNVVKIEGDENKN